jgi:hypothetical protein
MDTDPSVFTGFRLISSCLFSEDELQSLVNDTTSTPPTLPKHVENMGRPVSNIFNLLEKSNCQTIIVEKDYTDRDYKSEFSAFYSKRFLVPSARCDRLHFFSKPMVAYGSIVTAKQIEDFSDEDYLGFCVVRPTEFNRLGRSILKYPNPPVLDPSKIIDVSCKVKFTVHLLGRRFEVDGFPFMQQDTQVGACAHTALWMVARYMNLAGNCGEFSPQQINNLGKSRQPRGRNFPAEDGLFTTQMLDALHAMNLFPIEYQKADFEKREGARLENKADRIGSIIYHYIESGFPVIIGLKTHVVVAIGHTLDTTKIAHNTIQRVPSFIIHDDLLGPYLEFPLSPSVSAYNPELIDSLIAILPSSVHLRGEQAEKAAHTFINLFLTKNEDALVKQCKAEAKDAITFTADYRLRTYLMKTSEFLDNISDGLKEGTIPNEIGDLLLFYHFPRYVWVSEIFSYSENGEQKCIGKIILDSTAAAHDKSIVAIIMEKIVFLFNRRNLLEGPCIQPLSAKIDFTPRNMGILIGRVDNVAVEGL